MKPVWREQHADNETICTVNLVLVLLLDGLLIDSTREVCWRMRNLCNPCMRNMQSVYSKTLEETELLPV